MYDEHGEMLDWYQQMLQANAAAREGENADDPYLAINRSGRAIESGLEVELPVDFGMTYINDPRSEYTAGDGKVSIRVKRG